MTLSVFWISMFFISDESTTIIRRGNKVQSLIWSTRDFRKFGLLYVAITISKLLLINRNTHRVNYHTDIFQIFTELLLRYGECWSLIYLDRQRIHLSYYFRNQLNWTIIKYMREVDSFIFQFYRFVYIQIICLFRKPFIRVVSHPQCFPKRPIILIPI